MSYSPQYLSNLIPPIPTKMASGSGWQRVRANHGQLFRYYEPTVAQWAGNPLETLTTGASEDLLRFRSRNGADFAVGGVGLQLRVDVMARRTNGAAAAAVLSLAGGTALVSANVSGITFAKVTLTATPTSDDEEWTITGLASAGDSLEVASMVAYWVSTAPGNRAYASGFRQAESYWDKDDVAVSTELAARLLNGPIAIAKDRPACVFSHLWRVNATASAFTKYGDVDYSAWGTEEATEAVVVGQGRIPCSDIRPRPFIVTYYLRSSASSTGTIRIGAAVFAVTANNWQAFQVDLPPVDVDIVATVNSQAAGEWAYFESVQVWRQAA